MKRFAPIVLAAGFLVCGCTTHGSKSENTSAATNVAEANPEVGMTKDQVVARYGRTDSVLVSNDGETWTYHMNKGEEFIPFNFGYRPKLRVIRFDGEGKVSGWSYTK